MRSMPLAVTWEILSRGWWILIGTALVANVFPAILYTALQREGGYDTGDQFMVIMHLTLVQINMFIFSATVFGAQGEISRLFGYPVRTSSIVAWQMIPAMALVALEVLASTAALNALFRVDWPFLGPALFVAVAVAAVQATCWMAGKSAWLPWALGIVALVLGLWNKSRYGDLFSQPTHMWSEVTAIELLTLLAFTAMSYGIGIMGVARQRRGDPLPSLGIIAWIERILDPDPEGSLPFRSPIEAQLSVEWGRKGVAMPVLVVLSLVIGCAGWLIFNRDPKDLFEVFIAVGAILSLAGFVLGALVGNVGPNDSTFEMGHFLATRPITSSDLARIILKSTAKGVVAAWAIWAGAFLSLYLILLAIHPTPDELLPDGWNWWCFPAALMGTWVVVMSVAATGLTGQSKLFYQLLIIPLASFFLILLSKFVLSPQAHMQIEQGAVIALGTIFVIGTAWAFVAARRRALISTPETTATICVWIALSAIVIFHWVTQSTLPIPAYAFALGIVALAVAPLATTPLALSWNRNR